LGKTAEKSGLIGAGTRGHVGATFGLEAGRLIGIPIGAYISRKL
tara:strand:+ start:117956 stop:118087 length:132 start_codon:yes stop_codon:yes gene_type:complete